MNSVKNRGPIEKIMDTNANRKVQIPPIQTKKITIKLCEKSSLIKSGNVT